MHIKGNNYCNYRKKNRKIFTISNTETLLNESPKVTKQRKPSHMKPFSPNHSNKSSFHKATHSKYVSQKSCLCSQYIWRDCGWPTVTFADRTMLSRRPEVTKGQWKPARIYEHVFAIETFRDFYLIEGF